MQSVKIVLLKVRAVCKIYHQVQDLHAQRIHLISVDEKTEIQALERIHPTHPVKSGKVDRIEFEYRRHGTQALIANFEVATGKVIFPTAQETRTKQTFLRIFSNLSTAILKGGRYLLPTS